METCSPEKGHQVRRYISGARRHGRKSKPQNVRPRNPLSDANMQIMNIARRDFFAMVGGLGALVAISSSAEAKTEKARLILLGIARDSQTEPRRAGAGDPGERRVV